MICARRTYIRDVVCEEEYIRDVVICARRMYIRDVVIKCEEDVY